MSTASKESITTRTAGTATIQPTPSGSHRRNLSWLTHTISGAALMGLSLSLLASGEAEAVSFTFEKIADTNTPIPGSTGNFNFFGAPSLDSGNVAFSGSGSGQQGIYTNIGGGLNVVADQNTPIPSSTGNFEQFGNPSLDSGNVAFQGISADFSQSGIYTTVGGGLNVVADLNTPIPGGTGNFEFLLSPSLNKGNVAFRSFGSGQSGIYRTFSGELNVVADTNTPISEGTGNFGGFSAPSLDNGNVAFRGVGSEQNGIYTTLDSGLNVVADTNIPIPGGTGSFDFFSDPSLDNGDVAFAGGATTGSNPFSQVTQYGIYTNIDGMLSVVADLNTPVPGGTGNFQGFNTPTSDSPSLDNGNVAFVARESLFSTSASGIYTNIGGELAKVIAIGDLLDGKQVAFDDLLFGSESLSGNQIAFSASFTDGSRGVYVATVPEPSSVLGTLAFGAFGASWILKRRLKKRKSTSC